jgi:hypothetical protein
MMTIRKFFVINIFITLVTLNISAWATEIWYEDNNGGGSETNFMINKGFVSKFSQQESFSNAAKIIDVYMVGAAILQNKSVSDEFITKIFYPFLKKNNIKLALDAFGANWLQVGGKDGRNKSFDNNISQLKRLKKLGVEVSYISLQSVLSKPLIVKGKNMRYPMNKRIADIVSFSKAVREIYPNVEIGIIDASFTQGKEYKRPYRLAKEALAKEGIALSYIHLDIPFDIPKEHKHGITWDKIKELENYVESDLGLKFGIITVTSTGGKFSNKMFHEGTMASMECYEGIGGSPSAFILMSWYRYPDKVLPESAKGDDFPAMRTVLEFSKQLESIEKQGKKEMQQSVFTIKCTTK